MQAFFKIQNLILTASTCLFVACSDEPAAPADASTQEQAATDTASNSTAQLASTGKHKLPKDGPLSFNEHVQPILSASCYHCHGPDPGTRLPEASPLRLDTADGAFAKRENGKPVIIPGDPDNSLLVQLMESKNEDEVMPPHPSKDPHGKIMPAEDIAIIRRWVKEGAVYENHWSFIPPTKPELPAVTAAASWVRNPIDHFVAQKLEDAGLKPNADEEKSRLLRRLTFDLSGLPPTPDELAKFINDERDFDAVYLEKVNQLLTSDAYAEHFTKHWLDVARYADTHGIHIDNYRSIWPYRDWVIRAFQKNMPFDQFTREQIAGDMMPNATLDQKIASGFHRCLPTTGEGGAINEEYEAIYAQDRASTTADAWLGLTVGCAACHDHKFDPISTKENYQLTAFFRNTTMEAMDKNNATHPPNILVPTPEDQQRLATLTSEIAATTKKLNDYKSTNEAKFQAWLTSENTSAPATIPAENRLIRVPLASKTKGITDTKGTTYPSEKPLEWVTGPHGDAALFTNSNAINLGPIGDFERDQAFSYGAWLKAPHGFSGAAIAKMHSTQSFQGYDLVLENGRVGAHIIHQHPENFIKVHTNVAYPADQWFHALVTYDGSSSSDGVKIYINGVSVPLAVDANKLNGSIKTTAPLQLGRRLTDYSYKNGQLNDFQLFKGALTPDQALALSLEGKINALRVAAQVKNPQQPQQLQQLRDYYFTHIDKAFVPLQESLTKLTAENELISKRGTITLIMEEKSDKEPYAHVLERGAYTEKREKVTPNTPAVLPPMAKDLPKNRLGLAMWLTDPKNPMPARITVNRYWYYFFGSGIVPTTNDFGIMGARPSHPKLLDWLASDFVEHKWDLHHLVRTIVTSSTYRQSAIISPEKLEKDPLNTLLSRGPRYRLDSEQLRDLALASSGLLNRQIGGPPVKPYQPQGIWESVAMKESNTKNYVQDTGDNLYRRSLYTFWKRSAAPSSMEILNAPMREVSCTRRELTNTPLQAFVIMNDPQFVEASRVLATEAIKQAATTPKRIDFIAQRILAREISTVERDTIEKTLKAATEKFSQHPDKAKQLIAVGETKAPAELNPAEIAAWTIIANQILNMDEALNK